MSKAQRVTISLPAGLFASGEAERRRRNLSRSEYVAQLYREHLEAHEIKARIARYSAAYEAQLPDGAEDAVVGAAMEALALPRWLRSIEPFTWRWACPSPALCVE